jgi:hypothetical protein
VLDGVREEGGREELGGDVEEREEVVVIRVEEEDEEEEEVRESNVDERRCDRSVVNVSCILSIRCVPVRQSVGRLDVIVTKFKINERTVARERKTPKTAKNSKNPPKNPKTPQNHKKTTKKKTHPLLPLNILTPLPPRFLHVVQELGVFCCYAGEVFGSGGWGGC